MISSESDKFFERNLPWSTFRSVHLRSIKARPFFTVTFLTNRHPGTTPTIRKLLKYGIFWTFRWHSLGCITRRNDIKQALQLQRFCSHKVCLVYVVLGASVHHVVSFIKSVILTIKRLVTGHSILCFVTCILNQFQYKLNKERALVADLTILINVFPQFIF